MIFIVAVSSEIEQINVYKIVEKVSIIYSFRQSKSTFYVHVIRTILEVTGEGMKGELLVHSNKKMLRVC